MKTLSRLSRLFDLHIRGGGDLLQRHWFAFTNDGENALLLRAVFLPGQYKEIQKARQEAFMHGLLEALKR